MRILKVSLCNLNSLKGEHAVDFAEGPLATSGLYAITGPTGSGKTTLLDAITLALFGKAARYGNKSNPQDIMTRGAGESWAEVRFQTAKGIFTARWGLARAHGKADGKVQQPSRKIRGANGKIVTEQVRDADDKMRELTGLDYDRFMRSVMLAQGQFAKFLASKPNERAELLESMTGTELYSRLGKLAFDEAKEREAGILARETEAAGIPVLDAETRAQFLAEAEQARKDHASLKAEQQKAAPFVGKITTLREALVKIGRRNDEVAQAAEALEDMADDLEALARHRKTEPFADLLAAHRAADAALIKSRAVHEKASGERAEAAEALGVALAEHRQSVETARDEARQAVEDRDEEHKQVVQDHADAKEWLEDNTHLEKLGASLTKLSAAGQARDGAVDTLDRATAAWGRLPHKAFPKAHKAFPAQVEEVDAKRLASAIEACAEELRASVAVAGARLPDLRKVVEVTQARLDDARAVQRYAADRARLKEGDECPLCGSKHHDIRHKGPVVSVESIQRDLDKAKQEVDVVRDLERQGAQDIKDLAKAGKDLVAAQAEYVAANDPFHKLCEANGLDPDDGVDVEELEGEVDEYREAKSGLKDKLAAIAQAERDLADARKELVRLQGTLDKFKAPPAGVRLGKPGKRVKPLAEAEKAADKAEKRFREAEADALASNKPLDQAGKAMDVARRQLESKLGKSEFESVDDLLDAKLEDSAIKRITREKEAADKRLDLAKANLKAAEESVADLRRQKVPEGEAAEALLGRDTELREQADEALARAERAKGDLRADDEARSRKSRLEREMETEKASIEVWRRLRTLIGSADGASFSKFAQSITLDILMGHANRHMSRLNARYVLLRDPHPDSELALIVEDRHQGGHRRPMASLSGGESFLASLALALGLSDLAGKSVRIESLFIDEGFGTLDPEALEVALDALEGLRQGNRSVGIISHVSLLKERITTQIVVHKSANGHSRLEIKA